MKKLLIAIAATVLFAGCYSPPNTGRPGEDGYSETGGYNSAVQEPNDRSEQNKISDNLRRNTASNGPRW